MSDPAPKRRRRDDRWRIVMAAGVILASLSILLSALLYDRSLDNRNQFCANQHALIEMQRLFLAEHAAIRQDLRGAGIPAEHADHDLLEKLRVLIEAADCIPE